MAWVTPPTGTAGTVLTAATWNQVRDDLKALLPLDALAWTSYTPTLTQTGTVTKTVTYAKYTRFGNCVICQIYLTVTGTGTANSTVTISLPVTAASSNTMIIGSGEIVDTSAVQNIPGVVTIVTSTTVAFIDTTQASGAFRLGQTGTAFSAALTASGGADLVSASIMYEV